MTVMSHMTVSAAAAGIRTLIAGESGSVAGFDFPNYGQLIPDQFAGIQITRLVNSTTAITLGLDGTSLGAFKWSILIVTGDFGAGTESLIINSDDGDVSYTPDVGGESWWTATRAMNQMVNGNTYSVTLN